MQKVKPVFILLHLKIMKTLLIITICSVFLCAKEYTLLDKHVPSFSGITLNNTKIDSAYFNGKVTLVNFWSMGCRPCMKEMPFLSQLDSIFPDQDFQVLSIAPHSRERLAAFNSDKISQYSSFRKAIGTGIIKFDILPECEVTKKSPYDTDEHLTLAYDSDEISKLFEVEAYPTTFLIDRSGVIRYIHFGYPMDVSDSLYKKQLTNEIEILLKN